MWIVTRADVGRLSYGRMLRDRVITPLLPGIALPLDVPDSPAVRRHVLGTCVPAGCQATGDAALWAHGVAPVPSVIHVRCAPGRHVRQWQAPLPAAFHGVGVVGLGAAVADIATATADAVRWPSEPLAVDGGGQKGRRLAPVSRRAS